MSSPDCGLPNVDIFDPVQCSKRWSQCATQQQINVYLNAEIVRTQECLQLFKQAQAGVNEILDGKIKNHETRIAALESAEKELKSAQEALQKSFLEIQAGNTAYQTSVDNTLKLYQQSINALTNTTNTLTAEQQKMWNEINALKGSVDIAKIEQAIAGYDAIMAQTKSLIEENNTALQVQFKQLEAKFATLNSELLGAIADNESATAKRFNDFTRTVTADIEAQNTRLNTFINTTTSAISELQKQLSEAGVNTEKALADFQAKIDALDAAYKAADQAILERLAAEEQARKDGDNCLAGKLKTVESTLTASIKENAEKLAQDLADFETNMDLKLLQFQSDIRTVLDNQVSGLDEKLSSRIKSLEITEEAHNKTTNARIDALEKEVGDGVDGRIADAIASVNTRITKVESDAQTANAELEAKLIKQIADSAAQSNSDLADLKALVDTQGELITASRDEATLAWEKEVKDRIAGDEELAAKLKELTDSAAEGAADTEQKFKELQEALEKSIADGDKALQDQIDKLNDSDAKQWTTINNTVESQNQLREQVDKMQEVVDTLDPSNVEALTEKVNELNDKVAAIDSEAVSELEKRVELTEARCGQLEGQNLKQDGEIDNLQKTQASATADFVKLAQRVTDLEDGSGGGGGGEGSVTEEQLKVVSDSVAANSELIASNTEELSTVKKDVAALTTKVDAIKGVKTVTAVSTRGQDGAGMTDSSGQAVRVELNSNGQLTTRFSSLHHICIITGDGSTQQASQNGSTYISTESLYKLSFFPIKDGYAYYEASVYVRSQTMYSSMTEYQR